MAESSHHSGSHLTAPVKTMRRIIAEDPDWTLAQVPCLSKICLQSIMKNIEVKPIYEDLSPSEKSFVQEKLPLSVPLTVTSNLIGDGVYWQRRCKQLWDICDVSAHGKSWKRMFFERYMEGLIELFIPELTQSKSVLEMVPLCKNYVKKLDITQLLPPIKETHKEEDEDRLELTSTHDEEDEKLSLDHFNFNILLEKLINLEELHLVYRVKQCGMNFEWEMFQMTKRDCETLALALKSCRTLKVFHLYQSQVNDSQCSLLVEHLMDHPSLTTLDLTFNIIGNRGAKAVARLLNRTNLRVLKLYSNSISDHGAKAIARALSTNSTLSHLNLGLNRIGDVGGQAITQALLKNNSLQVLNLGCNEGTEKTAISLSNVLVQNKTLRSINLYHDKLGVEGGKALREAMSTNSTITDCNLGLTEVDEEDIDFINKVVWSNQEQAQQMKTK